MKDRLTNFLDKYVNTEEKITAFLFLVPLSVGIILASIIKFGGGIIILYLFLTGFLLYIIKNIIILFKKEKIELESKKTLKDFENNFIKYCNSISSNKNNIKFFQEIKNNEYKKFIKEYGNKYNIDF